MCGYVSLPRTHLDLTANYDLLTIDIHLYLRIWYFKGREEDLEKEESRLRETPQLDPPAVTDVHRAEEQAPTPSWGDVYNHHLGRRAQPLSDSFFQDVRARPEWPVESARIADFLKAPPCLRRHISPSSFPIMFPHSDDVRVLCKAGHSYSSKSSGHPSQCRIALSLSSWPRKAIS